MRFAQGVKHYVLVNIFCLISIVLCAAHYSHKRSEFTPILTSFITSETSVINYTKDKITTKTQTHKKKTPQCGKFI